MNEPPADPSHDSGAPDDGDDMHRFGAEDEHVEGYADTFSARPESQEEPLDDLTLSLTVRCGALRMTLGELRTLDEGSLIELTGARPGMASLYHGERPIAHGELVNIDGQLGLQISQVEFQQVVVSE